MLNFNGCYKYFIYCQVGLLVIVGGFFFLFVLLVIIFFFIYFVFLEISRLGWVWGNFYQICYCNCKFRDSRGLVKKKNNDICMVVFYFLMFKICLERCIFIIIFVWLNFIVYNVISFFYGWRLFKVRYLLICFFRY